jgi:hypothetical protein
VRLLQRLEAEIGAQPADERDRFRILHIKEKFGHLTIYLAGEPTPEMRRAIDDVWHESSSICQVCGERGTLAERRCYWSVRCSSHENWQF